MPKSRISGFRSELQPDVITASPATVSTFARSTEFTRDRNTCGSKARPDHLNRRHTRHNRTSRHSAMREFRTSCMWRFPRPVTARMRSRSTASMSGEDNRIAKCAALQAGCRPPLPGHQEAAIKLLNLFVALSKISNRHRTFSRAAVNSRIHLCHERQVLTSDLGGNIFSIERLRHSLRVGMAWSSRFVSEAAPEARFHSK